MALILGSALDCHVQLRYPPRCNGSESLFQRAKLGLQRRHGSRQCRGLPLHDRDFTRGLQNQWRCNPGSRFGQRRIVAASSSSSPNNESENEKENGKETGGSSEGSDDGSGRMSSGEDEVEVDLSQGLGDWREFRARLVKGGGVSLAVEEDGSSESATTFQSTPSSNQSAAATPLNFPQESTPDSQPTPQESDAAVTSSEVSSTWAHALASPEQGCLVIAHPDAFGASQQYFNQAVIFLFTHGSEGSAGVILNRPSQYTLGQVAGLTDFLPEFAAAPLYLGGDVGPQSMLCVHGIEELSQTSGVQTICPGIYMGGSQAAKEHIRKGKSNALDYRWFTRYAGWAPGQLEREVGAGYWFLAASSPDIVLRQCIQLKVPLWRQVLELMGGKYSFLSKKTYGEL